MKFIVSSTGGEIGIFKLLLDFFKLLHLLRVILIPIVYSHLLVLLFELKHLHELVVILLLYDISSEILINFCLSNHEMVENGHGIVSFGLLSLVSFSDGFRLFLNVISDIVNVFQALDVEWLARHRVF